MLHPRTITLRSPTVDSAELVLSSGGPPQIYKLTFQQVRLLAVQMASAVANWPVEEKPLA